MTEQCRSLHFLSLIVSDSRFAARNVDAEAIGGRLHSHPRVSQDDQLSLRPRTPGAQSTTKRLTITYVNVILHRGRGKFSVHVAPGGKCPSGYVASKFLTHLDFFTLLPYSPSSDCVLLIEWCVMQISKTLGSGRKKRTKSATATTDLMLGMMDLKIGNDIQH